MKNIIIKNIKFQNLNFFIFLALNYCAVSILKNFVLQNDWPIYSQFFNSFYELPNLSIINLTNEYLWKAFATVVNILGIEPEFILNLLSFIIYTSFSYYILKALKNIFKLKNNKELYLIYCLSILFNILPQSIVPAFNQVRQGLAIIFLIPVFINNLGFFRSFIVILFASSIHRSSLFFLGPLISFYLSRYALLKNKNVNKFLLIAFPFLVILLINIYNLTIENSSFSLEIYSLYTNRFNFGILLYLFIFLIFCNAYGMFGKYSLISHSLLFCLLSTFFFPFLGRLFATLYIPITYMIFSSKNNDFKLIYLFLIILKSIFEVKFAYLI
ncbi:EpsG family protein [Prochlorococcus marinus]|uniref:EpsG family protein n=1 Tax=Prochlorococcus marinus TaxID=1219 RepID=UPI001ADAD087|nr:hypothetical protein [Prochlorococcus marinus CUG1416]MBW3051915.1 hypothetical protein [Prochlorococcus marinus str. MU1416]